MQKLKMQSPDKIQDNIAGIARLFPNVITETQTEDGATKKAVDFDLLRQQLSDALVEDEDERYRLDWPGKKASLLKANTPITKTLRPCREESVNFDSTENLFIEGDNFEVLKILQESYLGKVKMIYIDPPYNTGNDFIYKDNFKQSREEYEEELGVEDEDGGKLFRNTDSNGRFHSDWLSMMYERLIVARDLLRDDGVIFISIDDGEQASLKRLCDEIYGEENFVGNIVWEKRYSPQNAVKWFSESHDFVIVYAKNKTMWFPNLLERTDEMNSRYRNPDNDPRGLWKPVDSTAQGGHGTKGQFYFLTAPNGKRHTLPNGRCWLYTEPVFKQMVADNRIWFGADGNNVPAIKRFLSEVKQGTACQTIWKYAAVGHNQEGKKELNLLFPESTVFDTPKPVRLLKRILQVATLQDSLILDFFTGSATTAHAAMQLNAEDGGNRKFIMVQLPEETDENSEAYKAGYKTIADIGKERIRRAGKKIEQELATKSTKRHEKDEKRDKDKKENDGGEVREQDIGFRVYKVDSTNMKDVYYHPTDLDQQELLKYQSNIKDDRSPEDLLTQVILDLGLELSLPIEQKSMHGNTVYIVQTNALVACFDDKINFKIIDKIAEPKPFKVVFKDASFRDDKDRINVEERFKRLSPETRITVL